MAKAERSYRLPRIYRFLHSSPLSVAKNVLIWAILFFVWLWDVHPVPPVYRQTASVSKPAIQTSRTSRSGRAQAGYCWTLLDQARQSHETVSEEGVSLNDLDAFDVTDFYLKTGDAHLFLSTFRQPSDSTMEAIACGLLFDLDESLEGSTKEEQQMILDGVSASLADSFGVDPSAFAISVVDEQLLVFVMYWNPATLYEQIGLPEVLNVEKLKTSGEFELWRDR